MVIPADLPALVAPVAWMLGTWEGWGMYAAPAAPGQEEPSEDSPVVAPSDAPLPPPGQYNSREFTATSASTEGHSAVWDGVSVGPRVQMVSDAIALGAGATRVTHLGRMFGLVAGELMWTQERTLDGEDEADVEISGRLMRTAQASTESGEVIEGIDDTQDGFLV